MRKVEVSELQGPHAELMAQIGGENGRARFDEFKLWLNGVVLAPRVAVVDLSVPCGLPFDGAERARHLESRRTALLERRGDDLHLDGAKLMLHFSREQSSGSRIIGHALRDKIEMRGAQLGARVLDVLVLHPELWPESWKGGTCNKPLYVFFWGDIFRDPKNQSGLALYVRYGVWEGDKLVSAYCSLDGVWGGNSPAASYSS